MDIQFSGLSGQSSLTETLRQEKTAAATAGQIDQAAAVAATQTAAPAASGDTVNISERGMQLSMTMQGGGGKPKDTEQAASGAAVEVSVEDLEQELQLKNGEVSTAEAEVEDLKRQARNDPSREAELLKKKSTLRDLEDEASDLKAEVYA
ncbi:hypothetical protein LJC48_04670 [Desulfovibrio sp. OttesenSCG-928-C06]|nr:hypothetical protein [Desulfovibrio sp. OttesenSCG-928-C06]